MPPSPRTDSTRDRILDAATAEFAQHGIAGARIDRIAKSARTSKERVYAYFRSKDELYRFVAACELEAVAEATLLDPADLPGYAGRVHDYFIAHPDSRRIMRWGELEGIVADDTARDIARSKVEKLLHAQQDGWLDPFWNPLDVLVFVSALASAWADHPGLPQLQGKARDQFLSDRRAAVVTAVERLFPAMGDPAGSARTVRR